VHGLASPLGAFFPIPHGVVCGTLVATATRVNIDALRARAAQHPALKKYARVGELLTQRTFPDADRAADALVDVLGEWTERLRLPRLRDYGVKPDDFVRVVQNSRGSSMKTNPLALTDPEIESIVRERW
jgi:alcohol dehydrogenase